MRIPERIAPSGRPPPRPAMRGRRLVRSASVILPLAALALLSTLFLLSDRIDADDAMILADPEITDRAEERQLTGPRFTGVSSDGTAFDLAARVARPDADDPRRMSAEGARLRLDDTSGAGATVTSGRVELDTADRTLVLSEGVRIETSTGFQLVTERLEGSLGALDVVSPGEVTGEGPLGRLRAGMLRIDEDESGAGRLLFTGGVDLLYLPPA